MSHNLPIKLIRVQYLSMKKYINLSLAFILILTFTLLSSYNTSKAEAAYITAGTVSTADVPAWIYIPSINLFSFVEGMGIDHKGNMDVPSGRTNNVGWYKYGVQPGNIGTAVFDAHNTAAFKNLHAVLPGSDIYILTAQGKLLHFRTTRAETYSMTTLSPYTLFAATTSKQINLITCAGTLLPEGDATHRLIVSAQLVSPETTYSTLSTNDSNTTSSTLTNS